MHRYRCIKGGFIMTNNMPIRNFISEAELMLPSEMTAQKAYTLAMPLIDSAADDTDGDIMKCMDNVYKMKNIDVSAPHDRKEVFMSLVYYIIFDSRLYTTNTLSNKILRHKAANKIRKYKQKLSA